jgi:hypothetical protein
MLICLRFAFYFTQHYICQLLFDEKSGDHYYIKVAESDDVTYVGEPERLTVEGKMLAAKRGKSSRDVSGKFEFDRSTGNSLGGTDLMEDDDDEFSKWRYRVNIENASDKRATRLISHGAMNL